MTGSKDTNDKHSGNEPVWYDDVVGNLETFTRLSKAGHFERANLFFERKLKPYSDEIPVAAQYADSLIDQGAFRTAEEFLTDYQPRKVVTGSEVATETQILTIFRLMLTIAQLYTKFEPVRAAEVAVSAIQEAGTVTIGEGMSHINLQIMILSLRIVDLVHHVPSLSDKITLVLPFETRSQQRPKLAWEDAIIALLSSQHLWEAQTLLAIHIRHHGVKAVSKPIDILDAVPRRQDAMYMLAYLTILTLLSKTLSWEKSAIDTHLEHWKKSHKNKIDPLSHPMDDITDPVTTSRAYQKLMVFQLTRALSMARSGKRDQEMTANFTSNADVSEVLAGLRDLRFEASCHKDYSLAMEIYEASNDILPDEYLQATGASKEAIELLHPDIRLPSHSSRSERAAEIKITDDIVRTAAGNEENAVEVMMMWSQDHEEALGTSHAANPDDVYNQGKPKGADETYGRAGEKSIEGLGEAIEAARHTLQSTPVNQQVQVACLRDLSNALRERFERTGKMGDLEEAIDTARLAVNVTPPGHESATQMEMLAGLNIRTPLSWAARNGHERTVKRLLDTDKVDVDSKDKYGRTPLSWAAQFGHERITKQLLDTGKVDVDSKDEDGRTPLSLAAENGNEGTTKQLLDTGKVDVDSKDKDGRTPLSWAAGKDEYGRTPLSWAAWNGNEGPVKQLLDTGKVDVDLKDKDGRTPLSWAARKGLGGKVKQLLDTGKVDIDSKDRYGRTPLTWAAWYGHEGPVKQLLDNGKLDVDSRDKDGRTPLSWAAENGHERTVKRLLDTGKVDVDSKDKYGRTPLTWATENGLEGKVKRLLDTGKVDVDSKGKYDRTSLPWAARRRQGAVAKQPLDTSKVDVDSKDNDGRTPLSKAAENVFYSQSNE